MPKGFSEIKQYVEALYQLAKQDDVLDKINMELKLFIAKVEDDIKLEKYLSNPIEEFLKKHKTIKDLFSKQLSDYTYNFVSLFLKKNELTGLKMAQMYFEKIIKERKNVLEAKVISAVPLTSQEENLIKEKLVKQTNKKVTLNITVDPNVLGGLIIQTKDQMIDASVLGKINKLHQTLVS